MYGYLYPERSANGRASIQAALDGAAATGRGTVVLTGEWTVNGTLYMSDGVTLLFEGATLNKTEGDFPVITNLNRTRPRGKTLFGTQRGLAIIGEGVIRGEVEFVNVQDFTVSGISFENTPCGVGLYYSTGGRLTGLKFKDTELCILAGAGTRNCILTDISAEGEGESVRFSSVRVPGRVVNYFGPDVYNNIVRGLNASAEVTLVGEYCYDIAVIK